MVISGAEPNRALASIPLEQEGAGEEAVSVRRELDQTRPSNILSSILKFAENVSLASTNAHGIRVETTLGDHPWN